MFSTINKFNIKLRLVEETDAEFIIELRTDSRKARFISDTVTDIEKQKKWIRGYKERELKGIEYYFIAIDEKGVSFATYRLYNLTKQSVEVGSFISKPGYNLAINVIKVDVILKGFVFEELNYQQFNFEVRKENKSVVNYHKKFDPILINEDELNFYFLQEKDVFNKNKIKFEKLF